MATTDLTPQCGTGMPSMTCGNDSATHRRVAEESVTEEDLDALLLALFARIRIKDERIHHRFREQT